MLNSSISIINYGFKPFKKNFNFSLSISSVLKYYFFKAKSQNHFCSLTGRESIIKLINTYDTIINSPNSFLPTYSSTIESISNFDHTSSTINSIKQRSQSKIDYSEFTKISFNRSNTNSNSIENFSHSNLISLNKTSINTDFISNKLSACFPIVGDFVEFTQLLSQASLVDKEIQVLRQMLQEENNLQQNTVSSQKNKDLFDEIFQGDPLHSKMVHQLEDYIERIKGILLDKKDKFFTHNQTQQLKLNFNPNELVMEIRPGVGGEEACLFANDLFQMYQNLCFYNNWEFNLLNYTQSEEKNGCKEAIFEISGFEAYSFMKYESGVHRVQRIPITDKQGRIHTSTATAVILPKAERINDDVLKNNEYKIETMRSTGPGGQSVNKSETAVRVIHLPTKMAVIVRKTSSQIQNKNLAIQILRSRLLDKEIKNLQQQESHKRNEQIGTGDRSEKIRTYNFPQDKIIDHRCKHQFISTQNLLSTGHDLNEIWNKLHNFEQNKILMQIVELIINSLKNNHKKN